MIDLPHEHDRLRREAEKLGIVLPASVQPTPHIECSGYELPTVFIWFCSNYADHSGFPHHGCEPPFGLLSPFRHVSDLQRRNKEVRRDNPNWPAHWVSFWHGSDGDYCFSFDTNGHPRIVYWYYNYGYHAENAHLEFKDDYEAADFVDWFARQVEWVRKHNQQPPTARRAR